MVRPVWRQAKEGKGGIPRGTWSGSGRRGWSRRGWRTPRGGTPGPRRRRRRRRRRRGPAWEGTPWKSLRVGSSARAPASLGGGGGGARTRGAVAWALGVPTAYGTGQRMRDCRSWGCEPGWRVWIWMATRTDSEFKHSSEEENETVRSSATVQPQSSPFDPVTGTTGPLPALQETKPAARRSPAWCLAWSGVSLWRQTHPRGRPQGGGQGRRTGDGGAAGAGAGAVGRGAAPPPGPLCPGGPRVARTQGPVPSPPPPPRVR